jgi:sensor domain CHASE-containing protein
MMKLLPGRRSIDSDGDRLVDRYFMAQIILPTIAVVSAMAGLLGAFMFLAAARADDLAAERQQHLIATVLGQNFFGIAHDQEAATYWDETVVRVRAPRPDLNWIDLNMGIWMYSHYGHDKTYILDSADQPIYAMQGGRRMPPAAYARDAQAIAPLIAELRRKLRRQSPADIVPRALTVGAVDLAELDGHPAIVSAKPIISDNGTTL